MTDVSVSESIRRWRQWKSGSVDELAAIGTAFVWSLGLEPLPETTASELVSRRTIRYYISNHLMDPPEGERRLATYDFRHLLQLLYIKTRQHAGDRLRDIRAESNGLTKRALEELVIENLPATVAAPLPSDPDEFRRPAQLSAVLRRWAYLTGREGRWRPSSATERQWHAPPGSSGDAESSRDAEPGVRYRVELDLGDDIALNLPADHPLVRDEDGMGLFLRGVQRMIRQYRRGGGPAGKER